MKENNVEEGCPMSEPKKKYSKLCIAGFIISVLFPVLMLFINSRFFPSLGNTFTLISLVVILLLPFIGLILSIVGLVTMRKKGLAGKGFGIAGIVLSGVFLLILAAISSFIYLIIAGLTSQKPDGKLPNYHDSADKLVSVQYYYREPSGYRFEKLDKDRLDEFADDLESMELENGGIMYDYWRGDFGIEMEFESGTYLSYDGSAVEVLQKSRSDKDFSETDAKQDDHVYVTNYDFWEVMKGYFPSIEKNGDNVFSRSSRHPD